MRVATCSWPKSPNKERATWLRFPSSSHWEISRAFDKVFQTGGSGTNYQPNGAGIYVPDHETAWLHKVVRNVPRVEEICRQAPDAVSLQRFSPDPIMPLNT